VVLDPAWYFFWSTIYLVVTVASTLVLKDDFTQTEQRIIQRILEIIFETYAKSWEPVYPVEFEYIRSEMNTQFANIATPNEVVVSTTFTIELGPVSGEMHICMPYSD
jgi:flagellar motor switch protein FliM